MKILITNDDGIEANGIKALSNKFKEMGEVTVVAPNSQMSASSHSITTVSPLRLQTHFIDKEITSYSINGTPVDCVKIALFELMKDHRPDIVLAGINHGRNTGVNALYSGTVAGATEGHLLGIPSFAISLSSHNTELDCTGAADFAYKIVTEIMKRGDKDKIFLNINVPAIESSKIKGIKVCKGSDSYWEDDYEKRVDPFGRPYYWFNGTYTYDANSKDTDDVVVDNAYVAVVPLHISFVNQAQIEEFRSLEFILDKEKQPEEPDAFKKADEEIERILANE